MLPSAFFTQGFSNYTITGYDGVTVAPGTQVNVVEPVYRFTAASYEVPTGTAPSAALSVWTPPLYIQNPLTATLTQRAGASITLNGNDLLGGGGIGPVTIGAGALLAVDPGQWISITSPSQITVAGTLRAPGGNIAIINDGGMAQTPDLNPDGLSIFISSGATLDVAAQAFTATDIWGRTYGVAPSGGSILLGTNQTAFKNGYIGSVDAFIIVQQNALLDASGARAVVDSNTLLEAASGLLGTRAGVPTIIAGNGGSITMTSYDGISMWTEQWRLGQAGRAQPAARCRSRSRRPTTAVIVDQFRRQPYWCRASSPSARERLRRNCQRVSSPVPTIGRCNSVRPGLAPTRSTPPVSTIWPSPRATSFCLTVMSI